MSAITGSSDRHSQPPADRPSRDDGQHDRPGNRCPAAESGAARRTPTAKSRYRPRELRYLTVTHHGLRRVALTDIPVGDVVVAAGDPVIIDTAIANRDKAVFAEPDRLDVRRDARRHLSFGFGLHQCLGMPLARIELQVVFSTLFRRIPTLRLAIDPEHIWFKDASGIYGAHELPVAW
jgi:cytochrome P450